MSTELDKSDKNAVIDQLDRVVETYQLAKLSELKPVKRSIELARGMYELRQMFTEDFVKRTFMPLRGTPLGFKTDADHEGPEKQYGWMTVRDCVVETLLRGFYPIGNEMNIIAGRAYFTKEAFDRAVPDYPGVTELIVERGVPQPGMNNTALVPIRASWKLNGRPDQLVCELVKGSDGTERDLRIPVRINSGMGVDAVLGKAHRKLFARIYERLTKCKMAEDGDPTDGSPTIETEGTEAPAAPKGPVDDLLGRQRQRTVAKRGQQTLVDETPMRQPGDD